MIGGWILTVLSCLAAVLPAQIRCESQWQAPSRIAGTDAGGVAMTRWDTDGSGRLPPQLVVGGPFDAAGRAVADSVARGIRLPASGRRWRQARRSCSSRPVTARYGVERLPCTVSCGNGMP